MEVISKVEYVVAADSGEIDQKVLVELSDLQLACVGGGNGEATMI